MLKRSAMFRQAFSATVACCLIGFQYMPVEAADPEKEPQGWGELRFGMTAAEVVEKLGTSARVTRPEIQRPLMLDDRRTPDLQAALALSKNLVEAPGVDEKSPKIMAAKAILDLVKPRSWRGRQTPQGDPHEVRPIQAVSGTLKGFSDKRCIHEHVVVQPVNKRMQAVAVMRTSLDRKSEEHVKEVERAFFDLTEILFEEEKRASDAVPPTEDNIRIEPIQVRGITLVPGVKFKGDKLTGVRLGTPGSDNPLTPYNPRWPGMYASLVEALSEKYGPPDEEGRGEVGDFAIWRFPKAVVRCDQWRLGLAVGYYQSNPEDSKKSDGL